MFHSGRGGGGRGGTPASAARKGNIQEYKGTKISFDDQKILADQKSSRQV